MFARIRKQIAERFGRLTGRKPPTASVRETSFSEARTKGKLDPAALSRLGSSPFLAKLVVEGFLTGLHKSPFHGFSVEFADHREYVPGDDLKYLDWGVFARTDRYYIKRFEEETNLRCYLLLDQSSSLGYGTTGLKKWDYGCFLCACFAYLMLKQQDAVGLLLFGDKPGWFVPPRCRTSQLRQIMQVLSQHQPEGRTHIAQSIRGILGNLKRRGLVVIVSDLIDDPEETVRAIRLIRGHRHDVVVFQLIDAAELEFPFEGATVFEDAETGEELEVDPSVARKIYLQRLEETTAFYRKSFREAGVDYELLDTRTPYDVALSAYLNRRAQLRG